MLMGHDLSRLIWIAVRFGNADLAVTLHKFVIKHCCSSADFSNRKLGKQVRHELVLTSLSIAVTAAISTLLQ